MEKSTKFICSGNMKGGVGKTTSTIIMATELSLNYGLKVLVLDCDEQATITKSRMLDIQQNPKWAAPYPIEQTKLKDLIPTLANHKKSGKYDLIFIDMPRITEDLNSEGTSVEITRLLAVIDVLFIPFTSQTMDLQATQDFMAYVKEVDNWKKEKNYKFKYVGFHNNWEKKVENHDIPQFAEFIGLPLMENYLKRNTLISRNYSTFFSLRTKKGGKELLTGFMNEVYSIIK